MRKKITYFLLVFIHTIAYSQNKEHTIDSLKSELSKANDTTKVILFNALAKAYEFNEPHQFFKYALKAKQLAQQVNFKKGEALALYHVGDYYSNRGDYKTAKLNYEQSLALTRKLHLTELHYNLLVDVGSLCYSYGDQKAARIYYDTVVRYATVNKNDKLLSRAFNGIGVVFCNRGIYDSAVFYGIRSLEIAEKIKDSVQMGNVMTNLGIAESTRNDEDKAMEYFTTSLMIANRTQDKISACYNLVNMGCSSMEKKDHTKTIDYFLKALSLGNELNDKPLIAFIYANLGSTYYEMDDYDKAYDYYKYALVLAKESDDKLNMISILNNIGWILKDKKEYKKAIQYLEQALKANKDEDFKLELSDTYLSLAQAYAGLNDFKKAFNYHILYTKADSIIFNKEREQATAEVTTKYNIEKKVKEILFLKKDSKIKDLKLSNNRLILIATIIIFILTSIILFIFYNKFQIKKKANEEKEIMLREIHHRVKNNLQIILSILNIQARKTNDDKIIGFIKESESRIQAMAIIHEKLYQSDNLASISFKEYISELIEFIYTIYNVDKEKIIYTISDTDIRLDINTAVPLGLIINEMVCNSLKHAFREKENGNICIQLTAVRPKEYELIISDTGIGFPENFDVKKANTLGLKLIQILTRQMEGKLVLRGDKGTMFSIHFKEIA